MEIDETTCTSLLRELQNIWDEMGESDEEKDRMLLQLEQECLDVYRRKVDHANCARARLHQLLADSESELASLQSLLGDRPCLIEKRMGTLKEQLTAVTPQIEVLRLRKEERVKQFQEVHRQIQKLSEAIYGASSTPLEVLGDDLSLRKLHEYNNQLEALQNEQNERLRKVTEHLKVLHEYCVVLGSDFSSITKDVHPSLDNSTEVKSISDETLRGLENAIQSIDEERNQRMKKIQELATTLVELWNLMDTPFEERQAFRNITRTSEQDKYFREPGSLSMKIVEQTQAEVERLNELKVTRMKELVLKKLEELQEICKQAHMECDPNLTELKITSLFDSGIVDSSDILATIEENIVKANAESLSRKDIMERMEKWLGACEEETWLEEYNKDESRFNATKGAHLSLRRAERARVIVAKLPTLLDSLKAKTISWESERGRLFLYNGVSLLAILEEYSLLRKEKEEQKRRLREQKKVQEQLQTEQELLYGTNKPLKKGVVRNISNNMNNNRRLSLCPSDVLSATKPNIQNKPTVKKRYPPLVNYVAFPKDVESSSVTSGGESAPDSPVAA